MSSFNACFEDKNMDGQRLKSLNYLIALEMSSDCKNKRFKWFYFKIYYLRSDCFFVFIIFLKRILPRRVLIVNHSKI